MPFHYKDIIFRLNSFYILMPELPDDTIHGRIYLSRLGSVLMNYGMSATELSILLLLTSTNVFEKKCTACESTLLTCEASARRLIRPSEVM